MTVSAVSANAGEGSATSTYHVPDEGSCAAPRDGDAGKSVFTITFELPFVSVAVPAAPSIVGDVPSGKCHRSRLVCQLAVERARSSTTYVPSPTVTKERKK